MGIIEKVFSDNLRRLRDDADLTQAELAERTGLSLTAVQHYETNRRFPKPEMIDALAESLGVHPSVFFAGPAPRPTPAQALEVLRELVETPKLAPAIPQTVGETLAAAPLENPEFQKQLRDLVKLFQPASEQATAKSRRTPR